VNSATVATKTFSSSFLPSMASTTVFTNTTLDEIVGITGNLAGAWVGGDEVPYHFTNGTYPGGKRWATVQIQVTDSTYAKTVKVLLTQSGSNVDASVLYAKYANRAYTGVNFDSLIHATAVPIATSAGSPGYGVNSLTITTEVTTGTAAFTDPSGRTLTYSAPATSTGGGSVTINPSTGAFTYVPTTAQRQSATTSTTDTFTVTATNGAGRTATQTITVYVKGSPASETA
jgi:VCBS repeat-containing protein